MVMTQVEFPLTLDPPMATFETQFGCIERPAHTNTARDVMQHEVCGHRWGDISCSDYGAALLNDCKYGYSARGGRLVLTLLRAPKAPDPDADMGMHHFRYALLPHVGAVTAPGSGDAVLAAAFQLNNSIFSESTVVGVTAGHAGLDRNTFSTLKLFQVVPCGLQAGPSSIVLDTVKLSQDGSGDLILRLYEAFGHSAARSRIVCAFKISSIEVRLSSNF